MSAERDFAAEQAYRQQVALCGEGPDGRRDPFPVEDSCDAALVATLDGELFVVPDKMVPQSRSGRRQQFWHATPSGRIVLAAVERRRLRCPKGGYVEGVSEQKCEGCKHRFGEVRVCQYVWRMHERQESPAAVVRGLYQAHNSWWILLEGGQRTMCEDAPGTHWPSEAEAERVKAQLEQQLRDAQLECTFEDLLEPSPQLVAGPVVLKVA